MNAFAKTIVETIVVGAIGLVVALSANAVRGGNRIDIGRNYFPAAAPPPVKPIPILTTPTQSPTEPGVQPTDPPEGGPKEPPPPPTEKHAAHEFTEITLDELAAFIEGTSKYGDDWQSRVVFIDARNDKAFAEGHIPDAVQLDHFKLTQYIDAALKAIEGADLVVVYCNGGECEDSILTCRILTQDYEVSADRLRLYAGGWQEWKKNKMPCEGECKE